MPVLALRFQAFDICDEPSLGVSHRKQQRNFQYCHQLPRWRVIRQSMQFKSLEIIEFLQRCKPLYLVNDHC
jgi:hypothetical protein